MNRHCLYKDLDNTDTLNNLELSTKNTFCQWRNFFILSETNIPSQTSNVTPDYLIFSKNRNFTQDSTSTLFCFFIFSTFNSSTKQSPLRKQSFEKHQRKRKNCWLLAFLFLPHCLLSDEKCALFCPFLEKNGLLNNEENDENPGDQPFLHFPNCSLHDQNSIYDS